MLTRTKTEAEGAACRTIARSSALLFLTSGIAGLLDDLDKELNTYAMRLKEWYGWHFPEMQKLIPDNITYANVVRVLGMRENIANVDLAEVLPEELEEEFKELAMVSMGTEVPRCLPSPARPPSLPSALPLSYPILSSRR